MKRKLLILAASCTTALFLNAAPAYSQDAKKAEGLAKQSGCLNCHNVEGKKVGPGFKDVAAKNKGAKPDTLIAEMKAKPVHQAALKSTKEEDLKSILGWVLSLK